MIKFGGAGKHVSPGPVFSAGDNGTAELSVEPQRLSHPDSVPVLETQSRRRPLQRLAAP